MDSRLADAEETYAQLKEALLQAGAHARIDIRDMQDRLRLASLQRRATEQTAKAARMLAAMLEDEGGASGEPAHDGEDDATLDANGG